MRQLIVFAINNTQTENRTTAIPAGASTSDKCTLITKDMDTRVEKMAQTVNPLQRSKNHGMKTARIHPKMNIRIPIAAMHAFTERTFNIVLSFKS